MRDSLAAVRDDVGWSPAARRVATERLHLTLHFIGLVKRGCIELLRDSLDLRFEPFELSFGRFEVWPGGSAVWRPHETPAALGRLHDAQTGLLNALGLAFERRSFKPHVTLARHARGSSIAVAPPPLRWRVEGFALVESRLGASGGYSVIQRYP